MTDVLVKVFVDVLAALNQDRMDGNVFGFDTNRPFGSKGLGTSHLATFIKPGDRVFWVPLSLECEAHVDIVAVDLPEGGPRCGEHHLRGMRYWSATFQTPPAELPYSLTFELGHLGRHLTLDRGFRLFSAPVGSTEPTGGNESEIGEGA